MKPVTFSDESMRRIAKSVKRAQEDEYGYGFDDDEEDDFEQELDEPEDDDAFIRDNPRGGYEVSFAGKSLGTFSDRDEAEEEIRAEMEKEKFWPNVWFVDDHGGIDLLTDFYRE